MYMANKWLQHVEAFRKKHPNMKYGEALKKARSTYKADPNANRLREKRKLEFFAKMKKKRRK